MVGQIEAALEGPGPDAMVQIGALALVGRLPDTTSRSGELRISSSSSLEPATARLTQQAFSPAFSMSSGRQSAVMSTRAAFCSRFGRTPRIGRYGGEKGARPADGYAPYSHSIVRTPTKHLYFFAF
jgi:hypothetical protein